MKPRLLLINPVNPNRKGITATRYSAYPPLSLGIIAALTPSHWEVEILDENFDKFTFKEADLVGITAFTASVTRAYEIAGFYRQKKIHTVIGGIHASMIPEEAGKYVDTVVTGEAEAIWESLIEDFENDTIQPLYKGGRKDISQVPFPRSDLFHEKYIFSSIQTARGCPMDCDFCSVTPFSGKYYEQRPVDSVLEELALAPKRMVCFVDDNIIGYGKKNIDRAKSLFSGMIENKFDKIWFSHASMNFAEDEEAVELAARSGCRAVFLGVEAETPDALKDINKKLNLKKVGDQYEQVYKVFHKYKIAVIGAMIYGMEPDTVQSLKKRTRYLLTSGIDVMQALPLTPLPGTRLFEKMKNENRLLSTDFPEHWQLYDATEVTFEPNKMDSSELQDMMNRCYKTIYSYPAIALKTMKTMWDTKSINAAKWAFWSNLSYRKFLHPANRNY